MYGPLTAFHVPKSLDFQGRDDRVLSFFWYVAEKLVMLLGIPKNKGVLEQFQTSKQRSLLTATSV
jgi:hypothetical protein